MIKNIVTLLCATLVLQVADAQTNLKKISDSIRKAKEGEVVILDDFLNPNFKKIGYKQTIAPGPQFIISDDPEYIRVPEAIAMQEEVLPGAVRLYVYNVNGVKEPV